MVPKTYISPVQGFMLAVASISVTGHLLFIPVIINHAGRDSWISLLLAAPPFLALSGLLASLARMFPDQSIIQYSQVILGKQAGRIGSLLFLLFLFHDATLSIRGFGEFYTSAITPKTPIMVFFVGAALLAVYAVRSGIEVIARTNQLFLAILIPIGITATILTHKDKDYRNFLPVLYDGLQPVLMGTASLLSVFIGYVVMAMIFPHMTETKHRVRWNMATVAVLLLMFIGPVTGPIALFGEEASIGLTFPTFQILRDIRIGELQRLDMLAVMLWSFGTFSKISVFLYAVTVGIAQLFRLEDHRFLAVPIAALMLIVSLLNSDNFLGIHEFLMYVYPFYATGIGLLLPLLLWIAARWRKLGTR